uniref:Transmembrane protein n=1 Tax=Phytophthora ramorum TaxID=164328 RepID=H3GKZ7_PHYRM
MGSPTSAERSSLSFAAASNSQPQKVASPAPAGFYDGLKSPADLEGGALRPGGPPSSLYSRQHLGLAAHQISVAIVYGSISGVIYSVLNNYLNMSAVLVATAQALVRVPHALRVFTGLISDCYPIFGYRRRPYMVIGWALAFVCCLIMAVVPLGDPYYGDASLEDIPESEWTVEQQALINYEAPNEGIRLIILFMLAHLGTIIAYGAADGYLVELAQREPEAIRGSIQTDIAIVTAIAGILTSFMTGIGLNSEAYGGTFSWDMGFGGVMGVCAAFSLATAPLCWFCVTEEKAPAQATGPFFAYLYDFMQYRVIYQVLAFRFFNHIFSNFSVTASSKIKSIWSNVEPLNDGIASMISSIVSLAALYAVRKWGLHWSWRWVVILCQIFVVVIDCFPTFLTIWDIYRSQWFWLGVPLLAEVPSSIGELIAKLFVIEIADPGSEATVMGLIITINNIGTPFSTVMYKSIDSHFSITAKDLKKDTHEVRMDVTYAYLIAYAFNLASIVFVMWLPRQKEHVHELKRTGGKSKIMGILTIGYILFGFVWVVLTNALTLSTSTSCLRIAGGTGC